MSFWYMFSYALKDAISCIGIDRKNNNAYNVNVFEGYCHQPIWTKHILFPSSGRCFSSYCHNLMIYWPFSKGLNIPNQHVNCFGWEILILSQSQALWTDVFFNVFFAVVFFGLSAVSTNSYSDSMYCISWSEVAAVALPTFQTPPKQVLVTRVEHEHAERVAREVARVFLEREVFLGGLAETWRLTLLA